MRFYLTVFCCCISAIAAASITQSMDEAEAIEPLLFTKSNIDTSQNGERRRTRQYLDFGYYSLPYLNGYYTQPNFGYYSYPLSSYYQYPQNAYYGAYYAAANIYPGYYG